MEAISFIMNWIVWLLIIIPSGASAMIIYQALRKITANDDSVIADANRKIYNTIKGAIIGMTISGFITLIKSFFM